MLPITEFVCGEPESKSEFLRGDGLAFEIGPCNICLRLPLNLCGFYIGIMVSVKVVELSLIFHTFMLSMTLNFGCVDRRIFESSSRLESFLPYLVYICL
jgi:hypothetical protein